MSALRRPDTPSPSTTSPSKSSETSVPSLLQQAEAIANDRKETNPMPKIVALMVQSVSITERQRIGEILAVVHERQTEAAYRRGKLINKMVKRPTVVISTRRETVDPPGLDGIVHTRAAAMLKKWLDES